MLARFIKPILLVTGLITLAPVLEFLFPEQMNFFPGIEVLGETGKFMVRHHALEIACIGGLLIYAAFNTAARFPILVAAIVGKGGMVYMLLTELGNPVFAPMNGMLVFDALCVVLYVLYLFETHGKAGAASRS